MISRIYNGVFKLCNDKNSSRGSRPLCSKQVQYIYTVYSTDIYSTYGTECVYLVFMSANIYNFSSITTNLCARQKWKPIDIVFTIQGCYLNLIKQCI